MDTQAVMEARNVKAILDRCTERRWAREYMGLTQLKLATILHTHRNSIAQWESGEHYPQGPQRAEYAAFLSLAYGLRAEEIEEDGE